MDTYLVRLKCLSPYLTPWRNCTVWGRLCWIIADGRLSGWDIETWLNFYDENSPPLVLGDGFPADAMPVPALFQVKAEPRQKRPTTLPWRDWLSLCERGQWPDVPDSNVSRTHQSERTHVVMDRARGSAAEGGLRAEIGWFPTEVIIVAQAGSTLGQDGLENLFQELCKEGWGQLRTAGYGQIQLQQIEPITLPGSGAFVVTLGHCHPNDDLPQDGYWRWTGVPVRPHSLSERKGPRQLFTTMLRPGACFKIEQPRPVGGLVRIENRPDYRHYGIAPTWPLHIGGD